MKNLHGKIAKIAQIHVNKPQKFEIEISRESRNTLVFVVPIILCLGLSLIFFRFSPKPDTRNYHERLPVIEYTQVEKHQLRIPIFSHGVVRPSTEIPVLAEVSGRLQFVNENFADGGYFKSGDVLLRIDPRPFELDVVKKQAVIDDHQLSLEKIEAEFEVATRSQRNSTSLLERYQRQVSNARSQLAAARADWELSQYKLEKTEIIAPFDGRIKKVNVDMGQYLREGETLATLYALKTMEIRVPLSDQQLGLLGPSMAARAQKLDTTVRPQLRAKINAQLGDHGYHWQGKVVRSAGVRDNNHQQYLVVETKQKLTDIQSGAVLAPGMFVEIEIQSDRFNGIVVLPRSAMYSYNQVWVVDADERLQLRNVNVLYRGKQQVYIQQGLKTGEKVVINHTDSAVENMRVKLALTQVPSVEDR